MAWTSPRTWVTDEVVTASVMNTHIRDNLLAIGGAWTSYTPTLTWASSSFTFTRAGRYIQAGKLVAFMAYATISGGTYGSGTGAVTLTVPVTAQSGNSHGNVSGNIVDSGSAWYTAATYWASTTAIAIGYPGTNGVVSNPTSTTPFTWATNDTFYIGGVYEAA